MKKQKQSEKKEIIISQARSEICSLQLISITKIN